MLPKVHRKKSSRSKARRAADARRRLRFERFSPRILLAADVTYIEDFESGDGGFTVDNTGGTVLGLWHRSLGRSADGLPGHTPINSFYYGQFETPLGGGRYPVYADHQGVLSSPEIELCCGENELSFNYLLNTRTPLDRDFVEVRVLDVDTGTTELILSRAGGELIEGNLRWNRATADLSQFAGRTIQLQFIFDTGPVEPIDPEGWYVDDITINNTPSDATVSGAKFEDTNANGLQDPSETGLAGWEIRAYADSDGDGQLSQSEFDAGPAAVDTTNDGTVDKDGDNIPDAIGTYQLSVAPGDYIIVEVLQDSWNQSLPTLSVGASINTAAETLGESGYSLTVECEDAITGNDFGNYRNAVVAGIKFEDANRDGAFDAADGDTRLVDWEIFAYRDTGTTTGILDAGDTLAASALTNANGEFSLSLLPGDYVIVEEQRDSWNQSLPLDDVSGENLGHAANGFTVNLSSGSASNDNDFGNFQNAVIAGIKFEDVDGDGAFVLGNGDLPLVDWQILVYEDVGSNPGTLDTTDTLVTSVQTNAVGEYELSLTPGDYLVVEEQRAQWNQSLPSTEIGGTTLGHAANGYLLNLLSGQTLAGNDFGNLVLGSIHGVKYEDLNADGIRDPGEPALADVSISLTGVDSSGNAIAPLSVLTDATGEFHFPDLPLGTYSVSEILPNQHRASTPVSISNILVNSRQAWVADLGQAALPADSPKQESILDNDSNGVPDLAFGNFVEGSLHGQAFDDTNRNGIKDAGEVGMNDVTISLAIIDPDTGVSTPVTTVLTVDLDLDNNGSIDPETERGLYGFLGLIPGTYSVTETVPDGHVPTTATAVTDIVVASRVEWVSAVGQAMLNNDSKKIEILRDDDADSTPDLAFGNATGFGSIGGHKFEDVDGDGIEAPTEPRLNGFEIQLMVQNSNGDFVPALDVSNNLITTITADRDLNGDTTIDPVTESGLYQFSDVAPGTYRVVESLSAAQIADGWVQSTTQSPDIVLQAGDSIVAQAGQSDSGTEIVVAGLTVGNYILGGIFGQKFNDANGNGIQDTGDLGVNGITITLTGTDGAGNAIPANTTAITADRDLNGDGSIDPATERGLYSFEAIASGTYTVTETVPPTSLATTPNPVDDIVVTSGKQWVTRIGQALLPATTDRSEEILDVNSDSVSDLAFGNIGNLDFGDAPDTTGGTATGNPYPTLLEHDGARHTIVPGFHLGPDSSSIDQESDSQPNLAANGDDTDGVDDEDGVTNSVGAPFETVVLRTGTTQTIVVTLTNQVGKTARLNAWIDFDQADGWNNTNEYVFQDVLLSPGANTLTFDVPPLVDESETYARFRLSSEDSPLAERTNPSGHQNDGEVEDYPVSIQLLETTFTGIKYNDLNGNGTREAGEDGLANWTISGFVDQNQNGTLEQSEVGTPLFQTVTDAAGIWNITNPFLNAGGNDIIIVEEARPDWQQTPVVGPAASTSGTSINSSNVAATLTQFADIGYRIPSANRNESFVDLHFGNRLPTGNKFHDQNRDGIQDVDGADNAAGTSDDEIGLVGWEIRAYADMNANSVLDSADLAGGVVASSTTNSNGDYFLILAPGNYLLVEVMQDGWEQTPVLGPASVSQIDTTGGINTQTIASSLVAPGSTVLGSRGYAIGIGDGTERELSDADFGNTEKAPVPLPLSKRRFIVSNIPPQNTVQNLTAPVTNLSAPATTSNVSRASSRVASAQTSPATNSVDEVFTELGQQQTQTLTRRRMVASNY